MMVSALVPARSLRMAVIGCGPIGNLHARAIAASPSASLVAVCDCDAARRDAAARRFGVESYENAHQLFAKQQLDAVTVATPDHLHVEATLAAIAAGCHVFCEKPLATDLGEAERMVRAAAERPVQLAVDYNRRFAFGYRTAKRMLDEGAIGKLNYCLLRVSDATPRPEVARNQHVIFTTLLTHHLDLMRWYAGEVRHIQAQTGDRAAGALLTSVSVSLELACGAIGTIVAGYRDGQTRTAEWMELGGTAGAITVEDVTRRVTLTRRDPDRIEIFAPNHFSGREGFYDSLIDHVQAFIDCVARGARPPVTGDDGLVGMKLAAAAVESLARAKAN